jgi:cell division protein FtsB
MPQRKNPADLTTRNLHADKTRDTSARAELAELVAATTALEARVKLLEDLTKILADPPWARRKDRMPPKVTP